ncbi:haloacid dehalogenase type II [Streptomyces luteolus]|uniref:Haloacid dehalogenase type II n=1 Tax=Streptomyces luteolus TaxID=3043615 RepID=A0ABT6SRM9_9ACTN|nr:haloacid dehalogenase type II [Streptomyces sp. B-S-A12]MDI3417773.1 haloacid dehalogenase type II [Streptomyces sp. B-S-A12]
MGEASGIEVVVFDVLGTLVDEPGGLRTALREAVPTADTTPHDHLASVWQEYVARQQARIGRGDRAYADSATLDGEAARQVAQLAGVTDPLTIERLATASQRLPPWGDSVAGLADIARHFPVIGLSNADRATLLRLSSYGGLRWHLALSADDARACKPAPEVYRLALDAAGCPPERVLMVAAHAWDLRAAQAVGMRTAHVRRPAGDPPRDTDRFDARFDSLEELASAARGGRFL